MLTLGMNLLAVVVVASTSSALASNVVTSRQADPCAAIGGQKWVAPKDVRACYQSFPVDEEAKANIIEVINKTMAFHTSTNYQIKAPEPFADEVQEDVIADLARISVTSYSSDYELHIDFSRTLKRLNDGHCVWINPCYDSLFINYLPIPLVLLTDSRGRQNVHIAPEAFKVATAEFPDQIDFWQRGLRGRLESLSGVQVLRINGKDPWVAVDANALITGSYQAFPTRQNSFFASYRRTAGEWSYIMGNFAQQSLPLDDSVELLVQGGRYSRPTTITIPYRSRFGSASNAFTDTASWRANNCVAVSGTNGGDIYGQGLMEISEKTVTKFQQATPKEPRHAMNTILDSLTPIDVTLPQELQPAVPAVNGSVRDAQFYMLEDGITGVLALGSFSGAGYNELMSGLLEGLISLKSLGATQLIVDVNNNGGGYICVAHFLHRIIIGPKDTTVPQAGLYTKARAGRLAQEITQAIIDDNSDPAVALLYNPLQWRSADNEFFDANENFLVPPVEITINGRPDAFSELLGQECQPEGFPTEPPSEGLFDASKVLIISNGRCASSCSLFSITMAKSEGTKTVVLNGKRGTPQQYCGIVGGQSTDFSRMDTEIKTTHLKDHPLAPPDLIVDGIQGITWRLGFGIDDPDEPEEWQDHPADINFALTANTINNPQAIWVEIAKLF